jgi:hypothetical protein
LGHLASQLPTESFLIERHHACFVFCWHFEVNNGIHLGHDGFPFCRCEQIKGPPILAPNYIGLQKIIDEVLTWPGIVANAILCFVFMSIWVWAKRGLNVIERKERGLTVIPRNEWEAAQRKKLGKKLGIL